MLSNLVSALRGVTEYRERTLLSSVGVMAATVAIVLLTGIALGVQQEFASQVDELGVNNLVIIPGRLQDGFNFNLGGASYFRSEDSTSLQGITGVSKTAMWTFVGGGASAGKKRASSFLVASTPEWFTMRSFNLREGRLMQEGDRMKPIAVIGSIASDAMFPGKSALGKKITVNGSEFEVVGVTEDKEAEESVLSFGSFQNLIYLPFDLLRKRNPASQIDRLLVQIDESVEPTSMIDKVEGVLGKRLDESQFQVLTQKDLLKLVFKFTNILTYLLIGLTSIALFVGGIGIMTVMLLSIGERTSEIGIRMANGAKRRDIFLQFLIECSFVSLVGVAVGIAFSIGVGAAIRHFTPIKPLFPPDLLLGTVGVGLFAGLLFGILPAMTAAKKDPVRSIQRG